MVSVKATRAWSRDAELYCGRREACCVEPEVLRGVSRGVTHLEDSACALEWTVVSCDRSAWEIDGGCWESDRGVGEVDGGFVAFARGVYTSARCFVAIARRAADGREALAEMLEAFVNVTVALYGLLAAWTSCTEALPCADGGVFALDGGVFAQTERGVCPRAASLSPSRDPNFAPCTLIVWTAVRMRHETQGSCRILVDFGFVSPLSAYFLCPYLL